jgi:hypothetical protein
MTFQDYLNGQRIKFGRLAVVAGKVASKVGGVIDEASFREFVNYEESIEWSIDVKTSDGIIRVSMDSYCDAGLYEVSYKEFRLAEDGKAYFSCHLEGDDYPHFSDEDGRTYGFDEAEEMQKEWRKNH